MKPPNPYYCSVCGKQLSVETYIKDYDYSNGKPNYYAVYKCPDFKFWSLNQHDRRNRYAYEVSY